MPTNPSLLRAPEAAITELARVALFEDIGSGDVTSRQLIPADATAEMALVARQDMVVSGIGAPAAVYAELNERVEVRSLVLDGDAVPAGTALVIISGHARSVLTGERSALNLLQRLSGVATLTHRYVQAVEGTGAIILDTRKTMPGMRLLDKYAVRCGGGQNHRMGLDDMVLVKDNHIALAQSRGEDLAALVKKVRVELPSMPIVVECDTLDQVRELAAAPVKPSRLLLDNMVPDVLREAMRIVAGSMPLEASGGISLENVREIALTGVKYISIGRLTHSAPAVDIGADIAIF